MGLKVIFATSEAVPFAKTGGLADVSGLLPAALERQGCEVTVFMPMYRQVLESGAALERIPKTVSVRQGWRKLPAALYKAEAKGVKVYFITQDEFFDRTHLYGTPEGDYFDNLERFTFFSRAVIEAIKALKLRPDVIHCNDWQTGLVPALLKDAYSEEGVFEGVATVFTIHNIAYQGLFDKGLYGLTGLSSRLFTHEGLEFWDSISLLKSGIVYSGAVTTVSPSYAREIQTPEHGAGMEGVIAGRSADLYGVLNGVDYDEWSPEKDGLITANYSADDLSGKLKCRRALLKEFGLKLKAGSPVIGMISRLAEQKGFDILVEALPEVMKLDIGIAILGSGEKRYQDILFEAAAAFPGKVSVKIAFDSKLAHRLTAGSDIFLMPSRYEPCGLNQMFSLRYGTVPVVRATGGLEDTVRDAREPRPTGFKFKEYSAAALSEKVKEAAAAFRDKKAWAELQKNGMGEDFSWDAAARRYMEIYAAALRKIRSPMP